MSGSSRLSSRRFNPLPPSLNPTGRRLATHPVQLAGTVMPGAELTLISNRLTMAYMIDELLVYFPLGCDLLVRVHLLVAGDSSVSTAGVPPGNPLVSTFSPTAYVVGNDIALSLYPDFYVTARSTWLKAHLVNTDDYPHHIAVFAALRELMPEK